MRTESQLFELALTKLEEGARTFICNIFADMVRNDVISDEEYDSAMDALRREKPTEEVNVAFYNHPLYRRPIHDSSSWFCTDNELEGRQVRVEFLKMLVEKTRD